MKRVLVTGGLGYLGGRLAAHLARRDDLDLVLTGRTARRPDGLPRGRVLAHDLLKDDPARIVDGVRAVVHLAAANEIVCGRDPELALAVNGLGTLRLLRAAEAAGVERFIYLSTAHVYGSPLAGTIDETRLPRPVHPYAVSHRTAEDFVLAARDQGRIQGVVLRLSNAFGAPMDPAVDRWTLLANDLCRQAATTGELVLKSPGLDLRDFIPLADAVRAVEHVLDADDARLADGLFNLGGNFPLSVLDMARRIQARCEAVLGFRPTIERPAPAAGAKAAPLDYRTDKLAAAGFSPSADPDAEIDAALLFCRRHFGRKEAP